MVYYTHDGVKNHEMVADWAMDAAGSCHGVVILGSTNRQDDIIEHNDQDDNRYLRSKAVFPHVVYIQVVPSRTLISISIPKETRMY